LPASSPIRELRRKAADLIIDRIKHPTPEQQPITVAQAATDLEISRQAVYDIIKRKYCPSLTLIHRACEKWTLKFDFRGMLVESTIFGGAEKEAPPPPAAQMSLELIEAIRQIDYRSFEVIEAKPMGRVVEVTIRLTIPA